MTPRRARPVTPTTECECPGHAEGHTWQATEPPDWMDVSEWEDQQWADWYDETTRHCVWCGMEDG
jgi:hypothetical protein